MVTVLLMLVLSAAVRIVERFQLTQYMVDPDGTNYGGIIGLEISITWACLLLAEWLIATKYYDIAVQMPAVVQGSKGVNHI